MITAKLKLEANVLILHPAPSDFYIYFSVTFPPLNFTPLASSSFAHGALPYAHMRSQLAYANLALNLFHFTFFQSISIARIYDLP